MCTTGEKETDTDHNPIGILKKKPKLKLDPVQDACHSLSFNSDKDSDNSKGKHQINPKNAVHTVNVLKVYLLNEGFVRSVNFCPMGPEIQIVKLTTGRQATRTFVRKLPK